MNILHRIPVSTEQPYDVLIGRRLHSELCTALVRSGVSRVLILHQEALASVVSSLEESLSQHSIQYHHHCIEDAESGKTISSLSTCWDRCAEAGLGRRDAIISVGGGAATDLAGFVAATWMRGIKVFHIPTTLLAMVDASVGGKTGINTAAGKNLVGAFHEPSAVYVDLDVLRTLPQAEIIAGSAEIIKAGFISDTRILDIYEKDPQAALDPQGSLPELIALAIAVKAEVVSQDLKESHIREILNYGHTYGHAVEHYENYRWRHGHAVAVGMVFEAELACAAGLLSEEQVEKHRRILSAIGLPTHYDGAELEELMDAMGRDKKNRGSTIRFVVLEGLGRPTRLEGPDDQLLRRAYDRSSSSHID